MIKRRTSFQHPHHRIGSKRGRKKEAMNRPSDKDKMVLAPIEEKKDDPLEEAEDHSMNSGDYPKRRIK